MTGSSRFPVSRRVDQFTGEVRPSKFWDALAVVDAANAEADANAAEVERLREENDRLRCRLQELGETA
ncbi:hypothetical protein HWB60_gp051 [Mycobacterium phage TChen]|uniref:Uncharacterized protein n=1 Tax=Mycobacterium phage TChen TaxID=2163598 RepID=A0A2S1PD02_9CAUD|nr:hypothetical protein HWB60_gp051 [Mycobacterium phage TChen]AWH14450.1 hypothetical protein SEA_TCHEN_51 [Mycobacterium phage TChen]